MAAFYDITVKPTLEPLPDMEARLREAASRRILSARTRYVLTRAFYLDLQEMGLSDRR